MNRTCRDLSAAALICAGSIGQSACADAERFRRAERGPVTDLFATIHAGFAPSKIDDDLAELINELERYSWTPSRVFQRELGWTETSDATRTLQVAGRLEGDTYEIVSTEERAVLHDPGDYWGSFTLEKLRREHEYRWIGEDRVCLGDVPISTLVRIVDAALAALDGDEAPDLFDALPNTQKTWGRLGTIRVARRRDTAITMEILIQPERITTEFPAYARYLSDFVRPIDVHVDVRDADDNVWLRLSLDELTMQAEFGRANGRLAPLGGASRTLPEDLYLSADVSTKTGPFRVGFRKLDAHLRFERTAERITLTFLATREPEWRIPFLVKPFFTGALRHPFEGDGIESRTEFVREDGPRTLMNSDFRVDVKETWLLRRLGGSFGSEFDEDVERERREFWEAAIAGLREDVLGSATAETIPEHRPRRRSRAQW